MLKTNGDKSPAWHFSEGTDLWYHLWRSAGCPLQLVTQQTWQSLNPWPSSHWYNNSFYPLWHTSSLILECFIMKRLFLHRMLFIFLLRDGSVLGHLLILVLIFSLIFLMEGFIRPPQHGEHIWLKRLSVYKNRHPLILCCNVGAWILPMDPHFCGFWFSLIIGETSQFHCLRHLEIPVLLEG